MKSQNSTYLPAVDHLRAFAAILVILYHGTGQLSRWLVGDTTLFDHWPTARNPLAAVVIEGHTGVALFIVLSGFIFTSASLGRELPYGRFIRNRLLRIYPLFLLLVFVGISAFPERFTFGAFAQTVFALTNVHNGLPLDAFSTVFWTIAVEMQFYLVFPFLLSIVNRRGIAPLLGLVAVALLMRLCSLLLGANIRDLNFGTIVGRIDEFVVGMIIAVFYRRNFVPGKGWDALFVATAVLGVVALFLFNRAGGWPEIASWKLFLPTIEAVLWGALILGYLSIARFVPAVLSRALAAIGTISYSLYLLHMIVIQCFINAHAGRVPAPNGFSPNQFGLLLTIGVVLPLCLAFAAVTYRVIELPFLEMRSSYGETSDAAPAAH